MDINFTLDSYDITSNVFILKYKVQPSDVDFSYLAYKIPVKNNQIKQDWQVDAAYQIKKVIEWNLAEKDRIQNYSTNFDFDILKGNYEVTSSEINAYEQQMVQNSQSSESTIEEI